MTTVKKKEKTAAVTLRIDGRGKSERGTRQNGKRIIFFFSYSRYHDVDV